MKTGTETIKKNESLTLKRSDLHDYQVSAIKFAHSQPKCALFLDMGLGKTATSLTIASDFLDNFFISRVLIIAPLRVARTVWKQEAKKWEHLKNINIEICTGSEKERSLSLNSDAEIHVINREVVDKIVEKIRWKWDMIIIDESSSFKNHKSKRFKALKKVMKNVKSVLLLSGTPSPQGLGDLWSQLYLIDNGERLGRTITNYRQKFFYQTGYCAYTYEAYAHSEKEIKSLIKDVCITMSAKDYLQLSGRIELNEYVILPKDIKKSYNELEKEFIITLKNGIDIETSSASASANKLLQFCNGSIYDDEHKSHHIHDLKIKALKEIVEDNDNENFLIAYNFKSDLLRLQKAFKQAVTLSSSAKELKRWNEGKIKMLLAHPASAGHGLNMQFGGSVIVWFGLNWSLELYQQFNARLHRQGQSKSVRIIHIVAKNCLDEKVLKALNSKAKNQNELIKYLKYS